MSKNEGSEDCHLPKGKIVFFATGNVHKFNEAKSILAKYGIAVGMLRLKGDEIQSDILADIAKTSAVYAHKRCQLPIFVEDAGLFIDALNGFPGPYAAYVYKTIHNSGILKLMLGTVDRHAKFQSVIAYCSEQNECKPQFFEGECLGEITDSERMKLGKSGFGFDPIFQPIGSGMTFAEMSLEEKNLYSHRAKAIQKFAEWYVKQK